MIRVACILCPVDFSEFSRRALDHASALARWYGARLSVLHVVVSRPAVDFPPMPMTDEERRELTGQMRRFATGVPPEVALDLRVREASDVHREILSQAETLPADLLVVGSHGRSGFERLLLGSVTEKIIRKAACPTLVVPRLGPDRAPEEPVQFRRILCPVDFSDASMHALRYTLSLAEQAGGAEMTLLHVIEVPPELRANPLAEGFDVERVRAAAETECLSRVQQLVSRDVPKNCAVTTVVREGSTYREILKTAAERSVDLIAMGVHGRGAVDLLVFGSNTARVSRAAACPVLVVRQES